MTLVNSFSPGSRRDAAGVRGDISLLCRDWMMPVVLRGSDFYYLLCPRLPQTIRECVSSVFSQLLWREWGPPEDWAGGGCESGSLALGKEAGKGSSLSWGRDLELSSQAENFGTFQPLKFWLMLYFPRGKYNKRLNSFGLEGCLPLGPRRSWIKGRKGGFNWAWEGRG